MSARIQGLVATASAIVLVAVFVLRDLPRTSPGPLTSAHAAAGLGGEDACTTCHGEGPDGLVQGCVSCHAAIDVQRRDGTGFHGSMDALDACGVCHVEHYGDDRALVDAAAFRRAGVPRIADFTHAGLDFDLAGRHLELECAACHVHAWTDPLPAGEARFLGLDSSCARCHADPHDGALPDCAGCHGQERPFPELAAFAHVDDFPLEGAHGGLACSACHAADGERAVERAAASSATLGARNCGTCHASPHATAFDGCTPCHDPARASFDGAPAPPQLHALAAFLLEPPHDGSRCDACHAGYGGGATAYPERFPGRRADDCAACHADPHAGQFASSCNSCHAGACFVPSLFGPARHAATALPLEGRHAALDCAACHGPGTHGVRGFVGTPSECSACHADPHAGGFGSAGSCEACHTPTAFRPATFGPVEHASHGFVLDGAHAEQSCVQCHAGPGSGRARGCADCHLDPHGSGLERVSGAASDCARCHGTGVFDVVRPGAFEHARDTGFALADAHGRLACAACHAGSAGADEGAWKRAAGRRCADCHEDPHGAGLLTTRVGPRSCEECHDPWSLERPREDTFEHLADTGFPLAGGHASLACTACHEPTGERVRAPRPRSCASCHADPHAGQFAQDGVTRCNACHSGSGFSPALFDHARDSRFQLDATHRVVACTSCHVPWPLEGGGQAVRYKPLGRECRDCHGAGGGAR